MAKRRQDLDIAARMASRVAAIPSQDVPRVYRIALSSIVPNPEQPRRVFEAGSLQDLAESIKSEGLLFPILVCPREDGEGYQLIAGERRCKAHEILGLAEINAIVTSSGRLAVRGIIENVQRVDLHPLDLAESLVKLQESEQVSQGNLGKIIGKSRNTVNEILSLTKLAPLIKEQCRTSDTPKSILIEIARLDTEEDQLRIWKEAKAGNFTVRTIRDRKDSPNEPRKPQSLTGAIRAARTFTSKLAALPEGATVETDEDVQALRDLRTQLDRLLETYQKS